MSGGDEDIEILVVQAEIGDKKCRFINAYGPQEAADKTEIISFYTKLDQEIKNAQILDCLICIELDANAKVGHEYIDGDPHSISSNGILLINVIEQNNLRLCNADEKCDGLITRERNTVNGNEKSIIDYLIICENMNLFFRKMKIDSVNAFTKYQKKGKEIFVKKSDHHLIVGYFELKSNLFSKHTDERIELFNFNDAEGWIKFKKYTSGNMYLVIMFQRWFCNRRMQNMA